MTRLSNTSTEELFKLQDEIASKARGCSNLADAAQAYTSAIYQHLADSVILARLFATIPFKQLPAANQKFVAEISSNAGAADLLHDDTLVLSLLGSNGKKPAWNDRNQSAGHIGIPLVSAAFIDAIPMMSRLLKELHGGITWIDNDDTSMVIKTSGSMSGIFYVQDAASEVDSRGRKIIAAQDFVAEEKVKTVFGIGGGYMGSSVFFTTIIFLNETIEKEKAKRFMLQANKFKTATLRQIIAGNFFPNS